MISYEIVRNFLKSGVVENAADGDDEDKDDDEDEVHLKCGGVEKDVGRLGDVCSMHAVVVRDVLVKMVMMMINDDRNHEDDDRQVLAKDRWACAIKGVSNICTLLRNDLSAEVRQH